MEKALRFDRHARRRMKWRRISDKEFSDEILIISVVDKG